jgi:F-type H+-transporting ATPase subunit delta
MSSSRELHQIGAAFAAAAIEAGAVKEATASLKALGEVFRIAPGALDAFAEPALSLDARIAGAQEALSSMHPFAVNLLCLLIERDLVRDLPAVTEAALARLSELGAYHDVAVSSATELSAADTKQLIESLRERLGGEIDITETIDPSLLAGVVVEHGGVRMDASVRGRLNRLTQHLYGT